MGKFFPLSIAGQKSVTHLIVSLVIYILVGWALGFAAGLVGWLPLLGNIVNLVVGLVRVYCVAGIIVTLLMYFGFLPKK